MVRRGFRDDLVHILSQGLSCMGNVICLIHRGHVQHMREEKGLCSMFVSIWVPLKAATEIRMRVIWEVITSRSLVEQGNREEIPRGDGH